MVERVFVHIGLPKTGTSYLQTILWSSRDRLQRDGVILPGRQRRDHLWATRVVRGGQRLASYPPEQRSSWERILAELQESEGTGLISHEFFSAASQEQAERMIEQLAPAEVHVVVTARNALDVFTASWQESLKNKSTTPMARYSRHVTKKQNVVWNWRALDLRLVLQRWAATLPADRVHVLPVDTTAPREALWQTFAGLLGIADPEAYDTDQSFPNVSMGVAEAETLRRVNEHLHTFDRAFDRGVWIRTFLADERLVPRKGEKYWPEPDQIEDCRERARRAVAFVGRRGFDVRGDLSHLLVPDSLPPRRTPDTVTDSEVAEIAVELVATLLGDVRSLRNQLRRQEADSIGWFQIGRPARRKKRRKARS